MGVLGVLLGKLEDLLREQALDELGQIHRTIDELDDDLIVRETLGEVLENLFVLDEALAVFGPLTVSSLNDVAHELECLLAVLGVGEIRDTLGEGDGPLFHGLKFLDVQVEVEVFGDGLPVEVLELDGDLLHWYAFPVG